MERARVVLAILFPMWYNISLRADTGSNSCPSNSFSYVVQQTLVSLLILLRFPPFLGWKSLQNKCNWLGFPSFFLGFLA